MSATFARPGPAGPTGPTGSAPPAVLTVAASNSRITDQSDYLCDGTADQAQIISALNAFVTAGKKGLVVLLDGTYNFNGEVPILPAYDGLGVIGAGMDRTTINGDPGAGVSYFELSQSAGETLSGFRIADLFIDGSTWTLGAEDAYGNATITDTGLGVCERIVVDRVKIRTANRSCSGIVAHNDTVTGFAGTINNNWRVSDCDIKCDGDFVYGIKIQKRTEHIWIEGNYVELTKANVAAQTIGANNNIAVYGGSRYFHVTGNTVKSVASHSPIAISPARVGEIVGNVVIVTAAVAVTEGGIEVEWKAGHSDDTTPTEDVAVVGNSVIGARWGVVVRNTDPGSFPTFQPRGVVISGNNFSGCTNRDVIVEHGTDIALGANNHRNSAQKYDVATTGITFAGETIMKQIIAKGTGSSIRQQDDAGTDVFSVIAGRISMAEDIYFTGSAARGVRHNGTNALQLISTNNVVDIRPYDTSVIMALDTEIRIAKRLKWNAGDLVQTTVGAAGGASAPPATPTKYLKVIDDAGASLVIPAYTA